MPHPIFVPVVSPIIRKAPCENCQSLSDVVPQWLVIAVMILSWVPFLIFAYLDVRKKP